MAFAFENFQVQQEAEMVPDPSCLPG
jgi:hypothetical protein